LYLNHIEVILSPLFLFFFLIVEHHPGLERPWSDSLWWGAQILICFIPLDWVCILIYPTDTGGAAWDERVGGTPGMRAHPSTSHLRTPGKASGADLHLFFLLNPPVLHPCLQGEKEEFLPFSAVFSSI